VTVRDFEVVFDKFSRMCTINYSKSNVIIIIVIIIIIIRINITCTIHCNYRIAETLQS